MTPEQFTYWLQWFVEIAWDTPSEQEWSIIKDHLATVFNKVTPKYPWIWTQPIRPIQPTTQPYTNPANPFWPSIIC